MLDFLDRLPYAPLILLAVFMLLAPLQPMPHALEKLLMLKNGALRRPLDIFDLFFHLAPLALLLLKTARDYVAARGGARG